MELLRTFNITIIDKGLQKNNRTKDKIYPVLAFDKGKDRYLFPNDIGEFDFVALNETRFVGFPEQQPINIEVNIPSTDKSSTTGIVDGKKDIPNAKKK
jgi:hypothetical protein